MDKNQTTKPENSAGNSEEKDVKTLYEELKSHQIEIEMQNDELTRSKEMLATVLKRYEELYQQAPVGYLTTNEFGEVLDVNVKLLNMLQTDKASFLKSGLFPYLDTENSNLYILHCRKAFNMGKQVHVALQISQNIPETYYFDLQSVLSGDSSEGKAEIRTVVVDVSAQKLAETMSEQTKGRIEASMMAGNMAWWELELPTGKVIFNENKSKMLGYEASQFKTYGDFMKLVHPDDYEPTMEAFRRHLRGEAERYECEYRIKASSGEYLWFRDIGAIKERDQDWLKMAGIVINITELKEAQEKLLYQEKTAAVGQLTAGIAHEFNNALTGILGAAQYMEMSEDLSSTNKNMLAMIQKTGKRAAGLVKQMLDYSRKSIRRLKSIIIVNETFQLLNQTRDMMPDAVKVSLQFSGMDDSAIRMDRDQFRQLFQNLLLNARDAMPAGGLIKVTISAPQEVPEQRCDACQSYYAGHYLSFSVQDEGLGMDEKIKARIFEPFFTTKEVGQGSGLGLSQVFGIVRQYDGHIRVESALNKGTTIRIYLPESMLEKR